MLPYSLNSLSSEFTALFLLLDPVLASLGAGAFFSERLGLLNWMAFAVVLLGMYLALSSQSAGSHGTGFRALPNDGLISVTVRSDQ